MKINRWVYILIAAGVIVFLSYYIWYTANGPYFWPQYMPLDRLRKIQSIKADEIEYMYIYIGENGCRAVLRLPSDRSDIERVLKAVRSIRLSDKQARVSMKYGGDKLNIYANTKDPYLQEVHLSGRFDPARAPVISPQMRSYEFSKVMQDIVKRKGKKLP